MVDHLTLIAKKIFRQLVKSRPRTELPRIPMAGNSSSVCHVRHVRSPWPLEFVVDEVVDRGGALNFVLSTEGPLRTMRLGKGPKRGRKNVV